MKTESIRSRAKVNEPNFRSSPKARRYGAALILTLAIVASFGFARTSSAVPLLFTLTGVTFDDGGTASGFFIFNPSTQTYGAFDILTAGGTSAGSNYSSVAGTSGFSLSSPDVFIFDNFSFDDHYLSLSYSGHITGPGLYALDPGVANGIGSFFGSGEFVDSSFNYRLVATGFLTVAPLVPVPETGGTFLSLALGIVALTGFQFSLRRQRARML